MDIDKRKFLLKATVVGILATSMNTFNYNDLGNASINVPIWITTMVFMDYFRVILLLWVAFEHQMRVKNWIVAGLVGSLVYALSFWVFRGFISPEPTQLLNLAGQLIIGILSAVPTWLVLRTHYSKAYLWVAANAIGYSFVWFFSTIRNLILSIEAINRIAPFSFLTVQVVPNGVQVTGYALFGLFLGICLYEILVSSTTKSLHEIIPT